MGQFLEGQIRRLASIEDRFYDVRSEKSALQNAAYISLVEPQFLGDQSPSRNFSGHDPFVPLATACQGLQQSRSRKRRRLPMMIGRKHQPHLSATTLDPSFDIEADYITRTLLWLVGRGS